LRHRQRAGHLRRTLRKGRPPPDRSSRRRRQRLTAETPKPERRMRPCCLTLAPPHHPKGSWLGPLGVPRARPVRVLYVLGPRPALSTSRVRAVVPADPEPVVAKGWLK